MRILLLPLLFLLDGCSSQTSKSNESDANSSINVSAEDFKKSPLVPYQLSQDRYSLSTGTALGSETMSQLDSKSVGQVANEKDPMSVMMAQCYRGDFDNAFKIADTIYDSYQKHPSYWNQLGSCHLLKGNERKALLFYNKSLELKPNYAPSLNNIGVIYKRNNQDQKAHVAFERASKSSRFAKTPRYNLGFLYLSNGLSDKSSQIFRGLYNEYPSDIEILIGLANSLALSEKWSEALDFFLKIPDGFRSRSDVGLNMALASFRVGKKDVSRQILNNTKVIESDQAYASKLRQVIGE